MFGFDRFIPFLFLNSPASRILSPPPVRLIHQFPPGTFVENIACRSNGHLLLSILSEPVLYSIDPTAPTPSPEVIYTFPNATGMTGIAETNTPDVFAISAGTWDLGSLQGTLGSFSVWSVDFRSDPPLVALIAPIPDTSNLNGMTAIESSQNTILLADSKLGAVWALDMETGESQIAIIDPSFQPSYEYPMGINGIKTYGDDLYFTNSVQRLYGSIPIDGNGFATGPVNKLLTLNGFQSDAYDDFAMDRQGNAFIATHPNAVFKVSREGRLIGLLSSELLVQPTSATLGRGSAKEESTLYVSTGGRSSEPTIWDSTDDGPIVGGQVFAIDA